jgi:hypothetical protein
MCLLLRQLNGAEQDTIAVTTFDDSCWGVETNFSCHGICRLVTTHPLKKNIALMGDVMTNTGHLLAKQSYRVPPCLVVKSPVEICSHAGDCEDCYLLGCDVM